MSAFENLSRAEKLEYLELRQLQSLRSAIAQATDSYAGYVQHFSIEGQPARHHQYLIDRLDKVAKGEISRLMVFMPPGSAKSTYANTGYAPYWMLSNPGKLVISASHSGDLAERFGRKSRNVVADPKFHKFFGIALAGDSKAAGRWETSNRSEYYAVGVNGSVTGRRGDLGLIDDPVKGREEAESQTIRDKTWEWYLSDFRTRLKPNAAIIIIQTRWHEDDLSGRILPEDYAGQSGPVIARDGELWEVVNLPMEAIENDALGREPGELLWPQWFDAEWVEQEKRSQGTRNWNALYQQNPTPDDGDYYKRDDFRWYQRLPAKDTLKFYVAGDYAVSEGEGDYSEVGVFAVDPDDNIYLVDWYRSQVESLALVEQICDFIERHKPMANIGETGVIRRAVEPILRRRMRERRAYATLEWLPHSVGDKPAMGRSFQALVQAGRVYLPKGKDWAENLLSQLIKFPNGTYDDGADACALFGRYIDKVWAKHKPPKPKKPVTISGTPELTAADLGGTLEFLDG